MSEQFKRQFQDSDRESVCNAIKNLHNEYKIEQRQEDNYVNLTAMCQANGKKVSHWLELKQTKAYINQLSTDTGIPASQLITVIKGNFQGGKQQGTFGHALLAIQLGRWINPRFAIWCDMNIRTLIETGQTNINTHQIPKTYAEALLEAGKPALRAEEAEAREKQLKLQAAADKPKVEFANAIAA